MYKRQGLQTFNNGVSVATGQTYQFGGSNLLYANPSTSTKTLILGLSAGNTSITGNDIVAVGYNAGNALTSAIYTTLVGSDAGAFLTSAPGNTFIGYHAGYNSIGTVGQNTYIGGRAGEGDATTKTHNNNVGIGYQTLAAISTGTQNTVVGTNCAIAMKIGTSNTFIGMSVGNAITTGSADNNTSVGYSSIQALTTGVYNTVIGRSGGQLLTTGSYNTLLGAATTAAVGISQSICIGAYSSATTSNQCVIGSDGPSGIGRIDNIFLGRGVSTVSANTASVTIQPTGINAGITDTTASQSVFNIAGARGTGTGAGGVINFQTAKAGSTGSTQNTLVTQATVDMNFFGANHMKGISSTPTIAAGTGAGTSPTVSITGSDMAGWISVVAGTAPATSATIVTITFNVAYSTAPVCVSLTPANSTAAGLNATSMVFVNRAGITTTTFAITSGTASLTGASTYEWYYSVLQ